MHITKQYLLSSHSGGGKGRSVTNSPTFELVDTQTAESSTLVDCLKSLGNALLRYVSLVDPLVDELWKTQPKLIYPNLT